MERGIGWVKGDPTLLRESAVMTSVRVLKRLTYTLSVVTKMRLKIQYASDLHLEFRRAPPRLVPVAPILVLAGDIGNPTEPIYRTFLQECARKWRDVVVVAGNHEFYNKRDASKWLPDTVEERLAACRAAAETAGDNVHFLERDRVTLDGLAFLGCTLWSDVTGVEARIERGMNDCRMICAEGERVARAEDLKTWHWRDRAWLEGELAACREEGRGAVVVTHHLPTYDLIASRYAGHPLTAGFASSLDALICEPVRGWICGHSHAASILYTGPGRSIPCVLNPLGYPRESDAVAAFCDSIFVEVVAEAGPGESELEPGLVAAGSGYRPLTTLTSTLIEPLPGESGFVPSPQKSGEPPQSSAAVEMPPNGDSESDTSPESVVFL